MDLLGPAGRTAGGFLVYTRIPLNFLLAARLTLQAKTDIFPFIIALPEGGES